MKYPVIDIDCNLICDWDSFHSAFSMAFRFPDYYGRNLNAWIDCISDLESPHVVRLTAVNLFRKRCPEVFAAFMDCSAFVNWRIIEAGGDPVLFVAFHDE